MVGADINHEVVVVVVGVRLDGSETYTSSSFFCSLSLSISTSVEKKGSREGTFFSAKRGDQGKRGNFYFFFHAVHSLFPLYSALQCCTCTLRLVSPIIFNSLRVTDHIFHLFKFLWRSEIRKY